MIHEPHLGPIPAIDSILVSPGTQVDIALNAEVKSRLPAPYKSNCSDSWPEQINQTFIAYTKKDPDVCQLICYIHIVKNHCDCWALKLGDDLVLPLINHTREVSNYCPIHLVQLLLQTPYR